MQGTATAPALPNARDSFLGGQAITGTTAIDIHSPRFFVQMGWTTLGVDAHAIPNRRLLRGEVTPCASERKRANLMEIPEGMLIQGSEETDRDGRAVYGRYWLPAFFEAERLNEVEAATERRDGLVEIKALARNPRLYLEVDFNALFYPEGLDNLPETNGGLAQHLTQRLTALEAAPPPGMSPYILKDALEVGRELLAAANLIHSIQLSRLDYTHSCMKMPPSEDQYKRGYDPVDEEMLKRTGVPRIHEADLKVATAINTLAEGQKAGGGNEALLALVEAQKEQNAILKAQMEQQQQLLNQLLGDREGENNSQTGTPAATARAARRNQRDAPPA